MCGYGVNVADELRIGETDPAGGCTVALCHQPQPLTVRSGTVNAAISLMALVIV
jgi:hypothetical protein